MPTCRGGCSNAPKRCTLKHSQRNLSEPPGGVTFWTMYYVGGGWISYPLRTLDTYYIVVLCRSLADLRTRGSGPSYVNRAGSLGSRAYGSSPTWDRLFGEISRGFDLVGSRPARPRIVSTVVGRAATLFWREMQGHSKTFRRISHVLMRFLKSYSPVHLTQDCPLYELIDFVSGIGHVQIPLTHTG
jgi:hypothetical protein